MQERRNSVANALELRLSCININPALKSKHLKSIMLSLDRWVNARRNSLANALELRLSCININPALKSKLLKPIMLSLDRWVNARKT